MNIKSRDRKVIAVIICICFVIQIVFRSFSFDSIATPSDTVIALIFRDTNGYHIRNISSFLESDGTITMPTPRDLGDTNDESYSNWSPVLIENSFENVKKVIMNGGRLDIEDYDVSNPPTLATSSVATPSIATSTNSPGGDLVIRAGFSPLSNEESANTSITIYRSNVLFGIGNRVRIAKRNRLNVISDDMKRFISKNGNKNQIFFLAVQPPVEGVQDNEPSEVPESRASSENIRSANMSRTLSSIEEIRIFEGRRTERLPAESTSVEPPSIESPSIEETRTNEVLSTEESRQDTQAETNSISEVQNNVEESRAETNTAYNITSSGKHNSSGSVTSNIRTNVSNGVSDEGDTNRFASNKAESQSTLPAVLQNNYVEGNTNVENNVNLGNSANITNTEKVFTPMGNGTVKNSYSGVKSGVSIRNENSGSNGFINTKSTSVNISDDNFDADNYSVTVYKKVDGKEVLSNAKYSWSSDGGSHKANILFDDDGEYRIAVVKNNAESQSDKVKFEQKVNVDSTAPYITISGVEDLTANARTVSPVVNYSDVNIDLVKSKVTLTSVADGKVRELLYKAKKQGGGYVLNLDPIYIDDNYVLTVSIYDLAGNVTEKKVNFSVNKNGATFKFKPEELAGAYTNKPFTPSIEVWNTDEISIVSATVNGMDEPYEFVDGELRFLNSINKDGKYIFNLEVSDTAGNKSSMKPVEVIYDATKPVCIINGVEDGKSYEGNVNIILSTELPGDEIDSVWLDNRLLGKGEYKFNKGKAELTVDTEGNHIIKVQAKDKAGNLSDIETVSFEIKIPNIKLSSIRLLPWAVILLGLSIGFVVVYRKRKYGKKQ
ncbi:bacterial group 3 Ig-like domain protein [Lachnoanaerobaculum saburreum F0468]|jgi:hypothetical protein|uniref:Bacterial group 3 Ig-like domain protein n=1 Tax=Lachnoanaerobaculum saburreum F0468 TaxID=1095750 RepID=I0R7V9_9FIRM|nr:hypothetical protein [Lachnoanaerobaculum saburreum]EIC95767.1 bacterial group 3 Ig-like domain protein [Lachnoanaerobaculum saburreum F0468]